MADYTNLVDNIDRLASTIENKGNKNLAMELDKVANTLDEAMGKVAFYQGSKVPGIEFITDAQDRVKQLNLWLTDLRRTKAGESSKAVISLLRETSQFINSNEPDNIKKILESSAIREFESWCKSLSDRSGLLRNDIFFYGNTSKFTPEDLYSMVRVLDEDFNAHGQPQRNKGLGGDWDQEKLKSIMKDMDDPSHSHVSKPMPTISEFSKTATFQIPLKFKRIDKLISSMTRADTSRV